MSETVFLKLGGSLITEKAKRYTARLGKIRELALEIGQAVKSMPELRLVLGHGSGSFGHYAVQDHLSDLGYPGAGSRRPAADQAYWEGFAEVWFRASQLNRHVIEALHQANVPCVSFAPSAALISTDGRISSWNLAPLRAAHAAGLVAVVFGDIVFDESLGGNVLSTEALMWHIASQLKPGRVLLAGLEEAVWEDFPVRSKRANLITPRTFDLISRGVGASEGPDVTGGMRAKVTDMLELIKIVPGVRVRIFSGETPGNVLRALQGEPLGSLIRSD